MAFPFGFPSNSTEKYDLIDDNIYIYRIHSVFFCYIFVLMRAFLFAKLCKIAWTIFVYIKRILQFSYVLLNQFEYLYKIYIYIQGESKKEKSKPFFLSKSSSEIQKCVHKLFLSKSKILKRLNHRISENWQNCNWKIRNFQFWYNFYGKIICLWFLRF